MLIDTHAHLTDPKFADDLNAVLERAREHGVERILTVGDTVESSRAAIELATRYPDCLSAAVGIHPHNAASFEKSATLEALRRMASDPVCVAIGEIGLDYHYDFSPRETQRHALNAQIELVSALGLPAIFHCREAFDDFFDILSDHPIFGDSGPGGVLHCFTGDSDQARRAVDMGLYIGVGGMITFKKAETLREAVKGAPMERLLVETDAPYLAPHPNRGRRNEPAFTVHTVRALAALRGMDEETTARITTENARRLFAF